MFNWNVEVVSLGSVEAVLVLVFEEMIHLETDANITIDEPILAYLLPKYLRRSIYYFVTTVPTRY